MVGLENAQMSVHSKPPGEFYNSGNEQAEKHTHNAIQSNGSIAACCVLWEDVTHQPGDFSYVKQVLQDE